MYELNRYAQIIIKNTKPELNDEVYYGVIKEINNETKQLTLSVMDWRDRFNKKLPFYNIIISMENKDLIIKYKSFSIGLGGKKYTTYKGDF